MLECTVICIDRSGSMGAPFSTERTRMEAVKQMFYAFRDRTDCLGSGGFEIGLLQFDDKVERMLEPTARLDQFEAIVDDLKHRGQTAIYSAVAEAASMLLPRKEAAARWLEQARRGQPEVSQEELPPAPRLRILALTDGQNNSGLSPEEGLVAALTVGATVDAIIVGDRPDANLRRIVAATGGECFQIKDLGEGFELLEAERVVSLQARLGSSSPSTVTLENGRLPSSFQFSTLEQKAVTCVRAPAMAAAAAGPGTAPAAAVAGLSSAVATIEAKAGSAGSPSCRRALLELKKLAEGDLNNAGLHIFPSPDNPLFWRVLMEGPDGSLFQGGLFPLTVVLPTDYPFKPPSITFDVPVYHCNISDTGRICLDILKDTWSPALSVPKALQSIRHLLADPNPNDALRQWIAEVTIAHQQHGDNDTRYPEAVRDSVRQHASRSVDEWKLLWGCS